MLYRNPARAALGDSLGSVAFDNGFTGTGITWDGASLWIANFALGPFTPGIYRVDPSTGNTLSSFTPAGGQTRGLAWNGAQLFHSEAGKTVALYSTAGAQLDSHLFVDTYTHLAWNGSRLLAYNATQATIDTLNPATWTVDSNIPALPALTGLAWDGSSIWVTQGTTFSQINPVDGSVLQNFIFGAGAEIKDITFDGSGNFKVIDNNFTTSVDIYTLQGPALSTATPLNLDSLTGAALMALLITVAWLTARRHTLSPTSHPSYSISKIS